MTRFRMLADARRQLRFAEIAWRKTAQQIFLFVV